MTSIPEGLADLLEFGDLLVVALSAAVDQRELRPAVARRTKLPAAVIERCFIPGAPPVTTVAEQLVRRPLAARTVRWVLRDAAERRPEVLRALLGNNVPDAGERRWVLAHPDPDVRSAVLDNPDWPIDEQLAVAQQANGGTVMWWLSRLDPAVPVSAAALFGDLLGTVGDQPRSAIAGSRTGWRLSHYIDTALQAMLRRPWLADLPPALLSWEVRSAAATISSDERTLFALLGLAQRIALTGRTREAESIVEAVACNPTASLAVQRRARRLDRQLPCRYLRGWRPIFVTDGPLWEADEDAQRRVMDRLEQLVDHRHRTVWSAGLLALNPDLADDVRERLIAYVDEHLPGVEFRGGSVDVYADRLSVSAATRRRWHQRCAAARPTSCLADYGPDPATVRRWASLAWEQLHLDDLQGTAPRRLAVRRLRAAFDRDHEAWSLAFLLLREGWDVPLAQLTSVVATLTADAADKVST